jgi:hypothetical protein
MNLTPKFYKSKKISPFQKLNKEKEPIKKDGIEIKKSQTFAHIFKESFHEICSNSTSHGIPNIVRATNFVTRLFWLIVVCAAIFGCIYCNIF